MPRPKPIGASQIFAEAGQSQKVYQLSSRVEELEAEIVQLKSQSLAGSEKLELEAKVQELTEQLSAQGGVQEVAVSRLQRNIFQPRQTFPKAEIKAFAELLKEEGQHTPVILFPWENDYLIFDGERRWLAAQLIPWQTLKAVIIPTETETVNIHEIQSQALSTSIHRKDLHPLDLAECLINQIVYRYPALEEERSRIPTILNTCLQRLKRNNQISELSAIALASREEQRAWLERLELKEAEFSILQTLLAYQLNPSSISTNVFPMLAIASDLKEIVREFGLDASKVRELNKLSAENLNLDASAATEIRVEAGQKVATKNLSLNETRALVSGLLKEQVESPAAPPEESLKSQFESTYRQVRKSKLWDDAKKRKQLEKLLAQMKSLLTE